jgi:cyclic pyranopterin phosphate synthase
MSKLTHLDEKDQPRMVDVGAKNITQRTAIAESVLELPPEIAGCFDGKDIVTKKGAVFQTAIIAGIMASKRTHELIPMCHPLGLEKCNVDIQLKDHPHKDGKHKGTKRVVITVETSLHHKTGVEMEALTAASVAALTIYDMCKGLSQNMVITSTRLIKKTGGKSDINVRSEHS